MSSKYKLIPIKMDTISNQKQKASALTDRSPYINAINYLSHEVDIVKVSFPHMKLKGQNRTKKILRNVQQIKCPSFPTRSFLQGKKSHPLSARATEGRVPEPGSDLPDPKPPKKTYTDPLHISLRS